MDSAATPVQCMEIEGVCFMGKGETDHLTGTQGEIATIELMGQTLMPLTARLDRRASIFDSTS
jgi:hypothetical protein